MQQKQHSTFLHHHWVWQRPAWRYAKTYENLLGESTHSWNILLIKTLIKVFCKSSCEFSEEIEAQWTQTPSKIIYTSSKLNKHFVDNHYFKTRKIQSHLPFQQKSLTMRKVKDLNSWNSEFSWKLSIWNGQKCS